jgi:xanthine dehydrogenase accessory factor
MEARAEEKALQSLQTGESSLVRFELYADITSEEEAICGGEATILFDAQPADHESIFEKMVRSLDNRMPGILATRIQRTGDKIHKLSRIWLEKAEIFGEEAEKQNMPLREAIKQAFATGKPVFLNDVYLEPQFPLSHLVIAGAGHVGQAVAHISYLLDFEVTVIDDRPEFANQVIVPEADHIIVQDIGEAIAEIPKTADTYFVIVTRGHSHDADALKACIRSDVAYIGMIGSGRKIVLMREKFIDKGWATASEFDRVHAPIGIDIQSKTVQEIAISIAAELVQVRNQVQSRIKEKK